MELHISKNFEFQSAVTIVLKPHNIIILVTETWSQVHLGVDVIYLLEI